MRENCIRPRISVDDATNLRDTLRKIVVNNLFVEVLSENEINDLRIWEVKITSLLDGLQVRNTLRDLKR